MRVMWQIDPVEIFSGPVTVNSKRNRHLLELKRWSTRGAPSFFLGHCSQEALSGLLNELDDNSEMFLSGRLSTAWFGIYFLGKSAR